LGGLVLSKKLFLVVLFWGYAQFTFASSICPGYLSTTFQDSETPVVSYRTISSQAAQEAYPDLLEYYDQAKEFIPSDWLNADGSYTYKKTDPPILSIIIPAYKEAHRLPQTILEIKDFFTKFPFPVEVQLRIEKSPDNTVELAYEAAGESDYIHVFGHDIQKGKGYAVRQGILESKGAILLFMDADLSTPLPEIFKFLSYFNQNPSVDVLIGDRHHPDSQITRYQDWARRLMGTTFRKLTLGCLSQFGLKGIYDTQCGFKMFSANAGKDVFSRSKTDGFAFDVEVLMYASQLGYNIISVPIYWVNDDRSTVSSIRDPSKMLVDLARISYKVRKDLKK
jgi:dolichyl-phosphate beta-glucosyltransferase